MGNLCLSKNWEQVTDNPDHIQLAASAHELSVKVAIKCVGSI